MKPSIIYTLLFCLGIVVQPFVEQFINVLFWLIPIILILLIKPRFFLIGLVLLFVLLGIFHTSVYKMPFFNDVSWIELRRFDNRIKARGVVVTDPEERHIRYHKKIVFQFQLQEMYINQRWQKREGKILVNVFQKVKPEFGDILYLEGKLHYPYNFSKETHFSYVEHLANRGIKYILSVGKAGKVEFIGKNKRKVFLKKIYQWRANLANVFKQHLSEKEAALMIALVLGQQEYIPRNLRDLFSKTGTAHILAVSGFNVGVIAFVVFFILKLFMLPRSWQIVISIFVIIFYALITGSQAPVVRSSIMAIVFLLSFLISREANVLNSLALSAFILLMINPLSLFDIGFQLSFFSVYFIVIICPMILKSLQDFFQVKGKGLMFQLLQSIAVSLAAFIGVSGLIMYYFGMVTPISIIANILVVPLSSINIVLGLCLLLFNWVCPILVDPFAASIHICLNITAIISYGLSLLPAAYFYLPKIPAFWTYAYYAVLVFVLFCPKIWKILLFLPPKPSMRTQ